MSAGIVGHKKPFVADSRDYLWSEFRKPLAAKGLLPTTIPPFGWGHGNTYQDWQMLGNGPDPTAPGKAKNGVGCCVWSSAANETKIALTDSGLYVPAAASGLFNGATTVSDYSADTGYNPTTGEHDEGTEIRQSLKYRQQTGIVDTKGNRHKIGAYVLLDPGNAQHMLEALYFFEGIPVGQVVTEAQMAQFNEAEAAGRVPVWDYVKGSPEAGGHCTPQVGRPDAEHVASVTWRLRIFMTKAYIAHQVDEAWAYVTPERISKVTGKSYEHASPAQLEEYLHLTAKEAAIAA